MDAVDVWLDTLHAEMREMQEETGMIPYCCSGTKGENIMLAVETAVAASWHGHPEDVDISRAVLMIEYGSDALEGVRALRAMVMSHSVTGEA